VDTQVKILFWGLPAQAGIKITNDELPACNDVALRAGKLKLVEFIHK